MYQLKTKIFLLLIIFVALFCSANFASATTSTITCDTTSSLTIPGAQNAYSMNFNCAVPAGAIASLEIKYTSVGDNDGRDYFMCGGSTLYTTTDITSPY